MQPDVLIARAGDLLRFDGRLSRLGFWRSYLALAIILSVSWCVALLLAIQIGAFAAIFFIPVPLAAVALVAISVRRLHDRGKSGWWAVLFVVLPELVALDVNAETHGASPAALLALLSLVSIGVSLWGWVEIGFRRGAVGPNRYGTEPAPTR